MIVFIILMLVTFSSAFGLGSIQFFTLEVLSEKYGPESRDWLIQAIGAAMTIGPVIVYLFSGPISAAFKKKYVMFYSAILASLILVIGTYLGWVGTIWIYLTMVGLSLGVFNAGKMSSVPLMSVMLKKNTTIVNGVMSIVFLMGLLSGFPVGTLFYKWFPNSGYIWCSALFVITGIIASFCKFEPEALQAYKTAQSKIFKDTHLLFVKHALFLIMGPILWGVAGAAQLAITAMVVRRGLGSPDSAAMIPLFAACGAIFGNLISPVFYKARYIMATIFAVLMSIFLVFIPVLSTTYAMVAVSAGVLGILFGVATNLNDSTLLERVGADGQEGIGAALQSAMLAFFSVSAGCAAFFCLFKKLIEPDTAFYIFAVLSSLSAILGLIIFLKYHPRRK